MRKTKKMLSAILTIIFSVFTLLSSMTVQAAVKNTVIPKVQFASAPVTEYTVGDRIQFNINSPNFKGKVEYRVVLWDDSKKSYSDLWNEKNGYPNHYYTKWQPTGNTIFTLGWPIFEPGNYKITVYAKRVGVAPGKAALKGMNCDSYKESVAFTVKPKVAVLDKEAHAYGSSDENKLETYKEDTKITAKNIALSNAKVEGDLYILEDNAVIKNVSADSKIVVDPGKDGNCILENVKAKNIEVLSGGKNSIHIKNVQAETMNISSSTPVRIEADGDTEIVSTTASGCVIFDRKNGTYGTIIIKEGSDGIPVIEFRGDIKDKVQVETAATIKTGENSKISNLVISTEKATDIVTLEGQYDKVEIAREVKIKVAANSKIENIVANRDANIKLDKTAVVVKVDKGSNNVVVVKEGTAEPSTPPSTGGGGGESSGGDHYVPSTVPVKSITITSPGNATEVIMGKTLQLSAVVEPYNATNKEVIWSVATLAGGTALIDRSTGFLQATGIGTVRVTATNVASGVTGVKDITITAPVETPIQKATVTFTKNPTGITLTVFKGVAEVQPEADGTYKLEKGDYTYTASKADYKTQSNVAFIVTDLDITNGKNIDVVLVKDSVYPPEANHVTTYDELVNVAASTTINDIVIDGDITIPSKGTESWTLDMSLKKITINPEKTLTLEPNSSIAFGTIINNGSIIIQGSVLENNKGYLQGGDILGSGMVSGTGEASISITSEAALRNALCFEIGSIDISMEAPLSIASDLDLVKTNSKVPSRRIHFYGNGVLIGASDGITFKVYSGDLLSQHGNTNNFYYSDRTTKIEEGFFAPEDHTFTWDNSIQGWVSNVTPTSDPDFIISNGFLVEYKGAGGEVIIPESVIRVMDNAFAGNTTITSIYFPKSVQYVGNGEDALRGCTGITSLTFSNTIQFMNSDLNQNPNIKELSIYKGDTDSIVRNCFNSSASENSTIEKINIGEDITEIKEFAFSKYKALKQVKLPNSLKVIDQDAFSGCENLESVAFPNVLEIIGGNSFSGCVKLLEIVIPNGIKEVGVRAFGDCTNLAIVSIPNGLTGLTTNGAFDGCTLLGTLHITLSPNTTILSAIYADVDRILIDEGITEIKAFTFNNLTKVKELILPGTVQGIEDRAFVGCTNLESITIPGHAITQSETFLDCPNIKNVTVSYKDNPTVSNRLQLPNSVETLDIAEGITEIEVWSFNNLNKLTTILLPNTLTGIGSDCFKNCGQFTMKVYENSYAHQYAIDNNIPFVLRTEE